MERVKRRTRKKAEALIPAVLSNDLTALKSDKAELLSCSENS
jgi:hypothetical protein